MRAQYGVPGWDAVKAIWWRERCAAASWVIFILYKHSEVHTKADWCALELQKL